ncbi:hypothetical protein EPUS_09116 [Endocarpon pusillum Z07020]|uniref:Uncharacterized protein n=1 Tax=Endocarpon pusillum (strain Z07020 / HMAS-L-300199) TaxID=1263415 RepID=U1HLJ4_ENDPU|nr:uncharacterized protein EPUS_09116 [Endocarpon pusillum Z07020]ERF71130.1 hypothetical protein EPUS_09116 [Endocarpon pusillum Z07020]
MVTINVAYTQAVNPAGVTPVLTREQMWAGMEGKVRRAHDFVPVFSDCKVIEEHDNVVVRETTLKPMEGRPGKTQQETCRLYKPVKVDFHEPSGCVITNMLSDGPAMTDEELQMTYFFEWPHPDIEAGSDIEKGLTEQHKKRGKMSVEKSIESIRRMVVAGKL